MVAVLMAALPVGTGPFMLAKPCDREGGATGRAVPVSTLLSPATPPIVIALVAGRRPARGARPALTDATSSSGIVAPDAGSGRDGAERRRTAWRASGHHPVPVPTAVPMTVGMRLAAGAQSVASLFDRACRLDLGGRADHAREAYLAVLAADLGHRGALANLGALMVRTGHLGAATTAYRQAVVAHPDDPHARTNLANLLRRAGHMAEARVHYEAALAADPRFAEAHQGLSYLLDGVDEVLAAHHRARGFRGRSLVRSPYRGTAPAPPRVLQLVSAAGGNIPTRLILDDRAVRLDTLVVEHAGAATLPPHDLVFNAIGDADRCGEALRAAEAVLARTGAPVVNRPARVADTGRVATARRLAAVPGVRAPRTALLPRRVFADGAPQGWRYPFLLRSPGFHTGRHLRRVDGPHGLAEALEALPGTHLLAIEWLDARGDDGLTRKYRAMLIGGEVLPLHLAIGDDWKLHHYTADMDRHPDRRDEEERFLGDMTGTIGPVATEALGRIAAVLGLDYAGVDFGLDEAGRLLLFEANATMVIARPGSHRIWAYRRPAIERALSAACALVARAAPRIATADALSG